MNKLLVTTTDSNGVNHIWVGLADDPDGTLSDNDQFSFTGQRVSISPDDELKMCVAGSGGLNQIVRYSIDGGANWFTAAGSQALDNVSPIRQLRGVGGGVVWMASEDTLYKSTNDGGTWADATSVPTSADVYADLHFGDSSKGVLIKNFVGSNPVGGHLYRTTNGGSSWGSQSFSLEAMSPAIAEESMRRVWCFDASLDTLFLLTSHRVLKLSWNGSSYDATVLWNFWVAIPATFPGLVLTCTGYQGGVDLKGYFDDLWVDPSGQRIWIAGASKLRARSYDAGVTWTIIEPSGVSSIPDETRFYRLWYRNNSIGLQTGSMETPAVGNERAGLWSTVNGGLNVSPSYAFPIKHAARHLFGIFDAPVLGCTDPNACNYDPLATQDDGTCQNAVIITSCENPSDVHHVSTPEISALSCHRPRWMANITNLDPTQSTQLFTFFVSGALQFQASFTISQALSGPERLAQFLGQLIAYINNNTPYTANLIPPLQNPFVPGSLGGFWIEAPDMAAAGLPANMSTFGLIGLGGISQNSAFDSGTPGKTIRVGEYPGCWTVCGPGDCVLAEQLTLIAAYDDCFRCLPLVPPAICRDCDSLLTVGGRPMVSTAVNAHANCVAAGQFLDFNINVTFATRTPQDLTPIETGNGCSGISPITLTFSGNRLIDLPVGTQFTTNPSGSVYTISSCTYNSNTNVTTIVSVENCQSNDPIDTISTYTNCDCGVNVLIQDLSDNEILHDVDYPCVGNVVNTQFSYQIPEYGRYKVTITSTDCASTRTCTYWLDSCDQFRVQNTGCHQFRISLIRPAGAPTTGVTADITVTDLATGTVVLELDDVPDSAFPKTFTGTVDTLYQVEVVSSDETSWISEVIDLCDLRACRRRMALQLFCGDDDPCDTECERTEEREQLRAEITRLQLLQSELEGEVYSYRLRWSGLPEYTTERRTSLSTIAKLVTTIQRLSLRCGICENQTTTNTVSECRSC